MSENNYSSFHLDDRNGDPKEQLQSMIMEELASAETFELFLEEMEEYEKRFGRDRFWMDRMLDYNEEIGDLNGMQSVVEEMELSEECDEISLIMAHARVLYTAREFDHALEILDQINVDQRDDEIGLMYLHLKGLCAFGAKQYKVALQCFEDVMLDLEEVQTAFFAAICYLHLGKDKRAHKILIRYQDQLVDEEDIKWIHSIGNSFDEFEILSHPLMPQPVRQMAGIARLDEFFENVVRLTKEDPRMAIGLLETLVVSYPDFDLYFYLLASAHESLGQTKEAKKWFRKLLNIPIKADNLQQALEDVSFHLIALDYFQYAPATLTSHLKRMIQETENLPRVVLVLLHYGMHHMETTNLLTWYLRSYETMPEREDPESDRLYRSICLLYFSRKEYLEDALPHGKVLLEEYGLQTPEEIDIVARSFCYMNEPFQPRWKSMEETPDFSLYLSDQLTKLIYDFYQNLSLPSKSQEKKINQRISHLIGEVEKDSHHDWELLLQTLMIFKNHLPFSPRTLEKVQWLFNQYDQ